MGNGVEGVGVGAAVGIGVKERAGMKMPSLALGQGSGVKEFFGKGFELFRGVDVAGEMEEERLLVVLVACCCYFFEFDGVAAVFVFFGCGHVREIEGVGSGRTQDGYVLVGLSPFPSIFGVIYLGGMDLA